MSKSKKGKICLIACFASYFLMMPFAAGHSAAGITVLFIVANAFLVASLVFFATSSKENKKYVLYNENTNEVRVLKRHKTNGERFLVEKYEWAGSTLNPAQATFTAVTVGGVTTGGVDVRGPSVSPHWEKTEKYTIRFRYGSASDKQLVNSIVLVNPSDVSAAEANPSIKPFLNGNTIVPKHEFETNKSKSQLQRDLKTNPLLAPDLYKNELIAMQLSYSEANSIVRFLCGN